MADPTPRVARRDRDPACHLPRPAAARRLGAAALGVLLVLTACGDDDDSEAQGVTTTTTTEAATTSTTETPPQTTTTLASHDVVDAEGTVRAWIEAIASGDDDTMVELVAPRSLEAFGGEQGVRDEEIALSEGWGAWASAEGLELTAHEIRRGISVVVLHGEVSQEGPPEESWSALPVIATADGDRVEPAVDLGEITVDPPPNSDIDPKPFITVTGPPGGLYYGFDGEYLDPGVYGEGEERIQVTEELEPGLHAFIAVLVRRDGAVMARTFLYGVAG